MPVEGVEEERMMESASGSVEGKDGVDAASRGPRVGREGPAVGVGVSMGGRGEAGGGRGAEEWSARQLDGINAGVSVTS